FDFLEDSEVASPAWPLRLVAREEGATADLWLSAPEGTRLWRARAPGPPGRPVRRFLLLESRKRHGSFTTVFAPRRTVRSVEIRDAEMVVEHADGTVHEHAGSRESWRIDLRSGDATSSIELAGAVPARAATSELARGLDRAATHDGRPRIVVGEREVMLTLGEGNYRRSEQTWEKAGRPTATLRLRATRGELQVVVASHTGAPVLIPDDAVNEMDNEHPDVNASGMQLYLATHASFTGALLRPAPDGVARVRPLTRDPMPISATSVMTPDGWEIRCSIPIGATRDLDLAVVVNEIPPGRERRRGQLVLGGGAGEWVYLRGDRHDMRESARLTIGP
ncbi:MAG TPA: hypothetical protein VHM30_01475, partial [Gemmatimonadaceae bacterium]|nr:hypothetical protein [Gemmatimonadaceae bacterium]